MRVRTSHHGTFVLNNHIIGLNPEFLKRISNLEYLDIFDVFLKPTTLLYADPLVNNSCDVFQCKSWERQIMTWVEYKNITWTNHGLTGEQLVVLSAVNRMGRGNDRRIIIWKELSVLMVFVLLPARTLVSRTKETGWIVFR